MDIKVRIAPSPTGFLHIGTARTALFNWLFARFHGGKFVLRIEDTDLERSDKKYERDIITGLKWLGLDWDEGPHKQSDRIAFYAKYIRQLLNDGKAFRCYHSEEELEQERKDQAERKEIPRHVCAYKYSDEMKGKGIIRLVVDENSKRVISFDDIIRERVDVEERILGDLAIAKDEETPLYNFAVVIDDYDMGITHVIRGEDHISNTPKQILIQEALGFPRPQYAHLPLILGPDRTKMSKRHGAVSINEYKAQGYMNKALVNYMAMLGFTLPEDKEIMSLEEIANIFRLDQVHKSGAVFDIKKLDWVNGRYIKKMSDEELEKYVKDYLDEKYTPAVKRGLKMIRERINKLNELEEFDFLYAEPGIEREMLVWKNGTSESAKEALNYVEEGLSGYEPGFIKKAWGRLWETNPFDGLRKELDNLAKQKFGGDRGAIYWPFRVALSGKRRSPDPIEILKAVGKEKALERIKRAIEKL